MFKNILFCHTMIWIENSTIWLLAYTSWQSVQLEKISDIGKELYYIGTMGTSY